MELEKILSLIEVLRHEIHDLAEKKDLVDDEIIQKSQELDELLNKYYQMLRKRET